MTIAIRKVLTDLAEWYIEGIKIRELAYYSVGPRSRASRPVRAATTTARATPSPDFADGQRAPA